MPKRYLKAPPAPDPLLAALQSYEQITGIWLEFVEFMTLSLEHGGRMVHEGVGGEERCLRDFDGKPDGERPPGRLRR